MSKVSKAKEEKPTEEKASIYVLCTKHRAGKEVATIHEAEEWHAKHAATADKLPPPQKCGLATTTSKAAYESVCKIR